MEPEEEIAVAFERRLGTVAVVDVEVDHGDARTPVSAPRPLSADHDIVEEAEPHWPARLGMVAGWAHRAEGVVHLAGEHRVHGSRHCACRAPRRLARGRRHDRVGIDRNPSLVGHVGENGVHQLLVVCPGEAFGLADRRLAALEICESLGGKRILDRPQPRARLGMTRAGVVVRAHGMAEQNCPGHGLSSCCSQA